jgi:hypothetical protein
MAKFEPRSRFAQGESLSLQARRLAKGHGHGSTCIARPGAEHCCRHERLGFRARLQVRSTGMSKVILDTWSQRDHVGMQRSEG